LQSPEPSAAVLKIKPDICHIHDFELVLALPFLRLFSSCKLVYDVHEVYPEMVEASKKIPRFFQYFCSQDG